MSTQDLGLPLSDQFSLLGLVSQRPEIFIGGSQKVVFLVSKTKVPNEEADYECLRY